MPAVLPSVFRRIARRIARAVRAMLLSPPVLGSAYVVGLAAWAGTRTGAVDADVGDVRRAEAMQTFMYRRFPSEIFRM